MTGVKGRSGRPKKWDDYPPLVESRKRDLENYYKNRERALRLRKKYHKRIRDYADTKGISFEEARKIVGNLKKKNGSVSHLGDRL